MRKPPDTIDGAKVLWWAWADEGPFGFCGDVEIHGLAICRYKSGIVYRFSCDRDWQTVNDSPHRDEEQAKTALPQNYSASADRIHWHRYTD